MYSFVARQPIFDRELHTVAYELLFRSGVSNYFPNVPAEYATSQMISDQFLGTPIFRLVGEHRSFINFPYQMIIQGMADTLPREKVVIEILEDAIPDDALFEAVQRLHASGYTLALDDFTMGDSWDRFFPYVKILKFDIRANTFEEINAFLQLHAAQLNGITLLAEKVETHSEFEQYKKHGFELFQGYFYSKPEIVQSKRLSHQAVHLFQLMNAVNAEELDFDKIELILERDLTLTYKILKYARNIVYRVSGISGGDHLTLKNIAMYLGRSELTRFVSLACLANLASKNIGELYHLSLARAKFCEVMVERAFPARSAQDAFLCGLFSLLDVMLDMPLEEIVQQIALSSSVRNALVAKKGTLHEILCLAQYYERREWDNIQIQANKLKIPGWAAIDAMSVATAWADATVS
jgi:c-di-GMP-related signal transduction protein